MILTFSMNCFIIFLFVRCYCLETKGKNDIEISMEYQRLGCGGLLMMDKSYKEITDPQISLDDDKF